ncbi:hypothetical protein [Enterobacter asburiae]|uniref:hypothetical protein n=1 Tax=Enterobacter asburiae TaxID=61645 RepID=UPI003D6E6087|nr:hypothetical protein [Enterobacter asburiae]HBM7634908.1 hypothetical protein [Enterobacter asburiae]HBM7662251.1 hypothetical protein [Enterobacter asburiae]HBM7677042.1 hypothetical protein [Enterobacter asburiae]
MANFYVHVRLFEANHEQELKFIEVMRKFHYQKIIEDSDGDHLRLLPGGYLIESSLDCNQIVNQTFSIANTVGVNADIFVCEFQRNSHQLPIASLVNNDYSNRAQCL